VAPEVHNAPVCKTALHTIDLPFPDPVRPCLEVRKHAHLAAVARIARIVSNWTLLVAFWLCHGCFVGPAWSCTPSIPHSFAVAEDLSSIHSSVTALTQHSSHLQVSDEVGGELFVALQFADDAASHRMTARLDGGTPTVIRRTEIVGVWALRLPAPPAEFDVNAVVRCVGRRRRCRGAERERILLRLRRRKKKSMAPRSRLAGAGACPLTRQPQPSSSPDSPKGDVRSLPPTPVAAAPPVTVGAVVPPLGGFPPPDGRLLPPLPPLGPIPPLATTAPPVAGVPPVAGEVPPEAGTPPMPPVAGVAAPLPELPPRDGAPPVAELLPPIGTSPPAPPLTGPPPTAA